VAEKRNPSDPESFFPSTMSWNAGTPSCKFQELKVEKPYTGDKKILVICTSAYLLEVANGKFFNTGHQSSETFVPIYHMDKAGFSFDFATPEGKKVALEEWTFGMATGYENKLREMEKKFKAQLDSPMKLSDVPTDLSPYAAVFLPGGHGPLIEQHKIERIGELLRSAHDKKLTTISLCHGPNAFRSAAIQGKDDFPYKGYKFCVFPDKVDVSSPQFGYLPGNLKPGDQCEAALKDLGMLVQNTEMDDMTYVDRELITGSCQLASQALGVAALTELAKLHDFKVSA
jgi:molecular chaperone Hsp31 and glyoxalase 3